MRTLAAALFVLLFACSGLARAAPATPAAAPCHAMAGHGMPKDKPPAHDAAAMNCCAACLPELAATVTASGPAPYPVAEARYPRRETSREGLSPAPEPGPPRAA